MAQLNIPVEQALALPPEKLGALLEPGLEYTGTVYRKVPFRNSDGRIKRNRYVCVGGTLPTLAAAMDKPELLRFLLDRGHDANSASQAAVEALLADCSLHSYSYMVAHHLLHLGMRSASECSVIASDTLEFLRNTPMFQADWFRRGITPLAAAVVCGSVACVRVLLERPGIWTTECPSVSDALALGWRKGDGAYADACRLVRTLPDGSLRPLALHCVIGRYDEDSLRQELAAAAYDTAAVQGAADALFFAWKHGNPPSVAPKLSLLAEHNPDAFRTPILRGRLASAFLRRQGDVQLLALVERFCRNHDMDLGYDQFALDFAAERELRAGLETLCAIGRPVLSCDTVSVILPETKDSAKRLRLLLKYVHFLPRSYSAGLSALACAVLETGSPSLLKLALQKGLLSAQEPLDAMLELTQGHPTLRARLLLEKRPDVQPSPPNWIQTPRCRFPEEYIGSALDADASLECCQAALLSGLFQFECKSRCPCLNTPIGQVDATEPMLLFSMQGKTEALRAFLSARPQRYDAARVSLSKQKGRPRINSHMMLTPLAAAALAGQTETVEMLLALGYDANEHDAGSLSLLVMMHEGPSSGPDPDTEYRELPLPPLLCATLSGSEETAALLRAHGAVWDMGTDSARYVIEVLRG